MENLWNCFVPTANAICGVITEHSGLEHTETHEVSITSYWSLWIDNLNADKGGPYRRNVQTGLADWLSMLYGLIPCIFYT
jgi:hypothetical protein